MIGTSIVIAITFAASAVTAIDFNHCAAITVDQLNADPKVCKETKLDRVCLEHIKGTIKGLGRECLENFSDGLVKKLSSKLLTDLTTPLNEEDRVSTRIPMTAAFLKKFLRANDWKNNPAPSLVKDIVASTETMDRLWDNKVKPHLLARLYTKTTFKTLSKVECARLDGGIAKALDKDALEEINDDCAESLSNSFFKGLDRETFGHIRAEAFKRFTQKQLNDIPSTTLKGLTPNQARNFGEDPQIPSYKEVDDDKEMREMKKERIAYGTEHLCHFAKGTSRSLSKDTRKALKKRCKDVWTAGSGATNLLPTMSSMVAIMAIALLAAMV